MLLIGAALVWAAPLAGLVLSGQSVAPYLEFPPRTRQVTQAPFSWPAFILLSIPLLAAAALYAIALSRGSRPASGSAVEELKAAPFPWWGWLGLALVGAGWLLAWNDVVAPEWRRHTFTPLWLGYIVTLNAAAYRRSGTSLLTAHPALFLALFPASALFWWLFEHLNRFAGNWYYTGTAAADGLDYFIQATLPFSSVLPAVASTWAWLRTFPRFDAMGTRMPLTAFVLGSGSNSSAGSSGKAWAVGAVILGTVALAGLGAWPAPLFSVLWIGPLAVFLGLQKLFLGDTLLAPLARGDWRPLLQPAVAALVCGFFWELWNWGSLAQWHYAVPYVQRFHIFEMPLLGYSGYLPFGIECAVIIDLVRRMLQVPTRPSRRTQLSRRDDAA